MELKSDELTLQIRKLTSNPGLLLFLQQHPITPHLQQHPIYSLLLGDTNLSSVVNMCSFLATQYLFSFLLVNAKELMLVRWDQAF